MRKLPANDDTAEATHKAEPTLPGCVGGWVVRAGCHPLERERARGRFSVMASRKMLGNGEDCGNRFVDSH